MQISKVIPLLVVLGIAFAAPAAREQHHWRNDAKANDAKAMLSLLMNMAEQQQNDDSDMFMNPLLDEEADEQGYYDVEAENDYADTDDYEGDGIQQAQLQGWFDNLKKGLSVYKKVKDYLPFGRR